MAVSKPDPATAGTVCSETVNTEKSKEGGKRNNKGASIDKNMPQALQKWCLSQPLTYKPCNTQRDPAHGQSLSREGDPVLLQFRNWCQHWTQHKLPVSEARVTNQVLRPLGNKASFQEKSFWILFVLVLEVVLSKQIETSVNGRAMYNCIQLSLPSEYPNFNKWQPSVLNKHLV